MKLEVIQDFKGCPDGITLTNYEKGDIIEVNESFADIIINRKYAKKTKKKSNKPEETKVIEPKETK